VTVPTKDIFMYTCSRLAVGVTRLKFLSSAHAGTCDALRVVATRSFLHAGRNLSRETTEH
jgi:hypothetical protein